MTYILDIIMIPVQLIVAFFTIYYTVIAVCGLWHRKEKNLAPPKSRFAVVIPAHNEEMVLADLLENLKMLKYPKELYDVYVIADNCTDHTADIARKHGAYVFERTNKELVGKGAKLQGFPKDVMEAAFKASNEIYNELSASNPNWKKVYTDWYKFRNDDILWFRFADNEFDRFMATRKFT